MKLKLTAPSVLFALALLVLPAVGHAIVVEYATVVLGGGVYRYEYTFHNDGGTPLQLVDLLFDPALYEEGSLTDVSAPSVAAAWSTAFLGSAPAVPALFDVLATAGGVPAGGSEGGFAVQFLWLGPGLPGAQGFQVYDPLTLELLQAGLTSAVPELSTVPMTLLGLLAVAATAKRRLGSP